MLQQKGEELEQTLVEVKAENEELKRTKQVKEKELAEIEIGSYGR